MKRTLILIALASVLSITGCNKWLDINDNPNYVKDADIEQILPSVQTMMASKIGYDITLYTNFWSQYVVQCNSTNQYYTIMTNDVTNSTFNSVWSYFYADILPGVRDIITKAEADGNATNYIFIGKSILAYDLYMLTSLFDQVAYTEGYLTETYTPHFDTGEQMLSVIIGLLEEVRAMDMDQIASDESTRTSSGYDMVFGGNADNWLRFANTLYLKVLLRDFEANKEKIVSLLGEQKFLDEDASFDNFSDAADKSNPLYESDRRQLNTAQNIRTCSDVLNFLEDNDPRIPYFYEPIASGDDAGTYAGASYGTTGDIEETGRLAIAATDPVWFSTVDEACFLQAEAYARLGDADGARKFYDAAMLAAFVRAGITRQAAQDFLTTAYVFSPGDTEKMLEQIICQKWASNVRCMPFESWFDICRTGYPARETVLTDYHGVLESGYPKRFIYSKLSADYNPNSPTPLPVNEKMWWHK